VEKTCKLAREKNKTQNGEFFLSEQSALSDIFLGIQLQKSIAFLFLSSSLFRGFPFVRRGQRWLHYEGRDVQYSRRDISDGGKCIPFNVTWSARKLTPYETYYIARFSILLVFLPSTSNLFKIVLTHL